MLRISVLHFLPWWPPELTPSFYWGYGKALCTLRNSWICVDMLTQWGLFVNKVQVGSPWLYTKTWTENLVISFYLKSSSYESFFSLSLMVVCPFMTTTLLHLWDPSGYWQRHLEDFGGSVFERSKFGERCLDLARRFWLNVKGPIG